MNLTAKIVYEDLSHVKWADQPSFQRMLFTTMAVNILNIIADHFGVIPHVTSGQRLESDYERLIAAGYHPADTSDHFYGAVVPCRTPEHIAKYGKTYSLSVGASDIIFPGIDTFKAYEEIVELDKTGKICCGQIIHEYGSGKDWIHVANDPILFYSDKVVHDLLNRPKYLYSKDDGKTYEVYNG